MLRDDMAEIDGAIHRLVRKRMTLARRVGRVKQRYGWAVRDRIVEDAVLRRFRTSLAPVGVSPERSDRLARWLIDESVRVQESDCRPLPRRGWGAKILIVGGRGAMGRWLSTYLAQRGHAIAVHDPVDARSGPTAPGAVPSLSEKLRDAEYVAIATPIRAGPAIYRSICRERPHGVVFDLLSVKQPILPWIRRARARGVAVSSVHPLFGPDPGLLSDRRMMLLDCGDAFANARVARLFEPGPLAIARLPIELHDATMAELQALPILTNLVFLHALRSGVVAPEEVGRLAPPTFLRQSEASRAVLRENPVLSFDILTANPSVPRLCARLREALPAVTRVLGAEGLRPYRAFLAESERWMSGAAEAARFRD